MLSVLLRCADSDCPFGIFKLFSIPVAHDNKKTHSLEIFQFLNMFNIWSCKFYLYFALWCDFTDNTLYSYEMWLWWASNFVPFSGSVLLPIKIYIATWVQPLYKKFYFRLKHESFFVIRHLTSLILDLHMSYSVLFIVSNTRRMYIHHTLSRQGVKMMYYFCRTGKQRKVKSRVL